MRSYCNIYIINKYYLFEYIGLNLFKKIITKILEAKDLAL